MKETLDSLIFALDIGTRSVVGVILQKSDDHYKVLDILAHEHEERSMIDGQIHDTILVSKVITSIKEELEKKYGPLTKVCVAAAGRALKTKRGQAEKVISSAPFLTQEDIAHLELSAVQHAQQALAKEQLKDSTTYYCVGYSVVHYGLDGQTIGNLIDQRGELAKVEVIATFLPKIVVESLIAALERSGLEMEALTLEPIAAINVLVPSSMRRLNIALVDIGAGTSDIAITKDNTIVAYGMVPIAGDEITESLCDALLLDFSEAERIKRALKDQTDVTFTDILGFETTKSYEDLIAAIEPTINVLADEISKEILLLNQDSPKAVMMVGGGSLTPLLTEKIAERMSLPKNRVAIRGMDAIQTVKHQDNIPMGPEFITPVGIAIAAKEKPINYLSVHVNDHQLRLFDVKKLTVGDALLTAGIDISKLYGKPGMAVMFELNGETKVIPGDLGTLPVLLKNGKPSSLLDPVSNGDVIHAKAGENGHDATPYLSEFVQSVEQKTVSINDQSYVVKTEIYKNGKLASLHDSIADRDVITIKNVDTAYDVLEAANPDLLLLFDEPFYVYVNGKKMIFPKLKTTLLVNGHIATLSDAISSCDQLQIVYHNTCTGSDLLHLLQEKEMVNHTIQIFFNGTPVTLEKEIGIVKRNDQVIAKEDTITLGESLTFTSTERTPFIFQDVFCYVDIHLQSDMYSGFELLKNGETASFHTEIHTGDQLEFHWIEKE